MNLHNQVAKHLDVLPAELEQVLAQALMPLHQSTYYHYVSRSTSATGTATASSRSRSVVLFRSPEEAFHFAKAVGIDEVPNVRPINAELVLLRMLADQRLGCLIFIEAEILQIPQGLNLASLPNLPGAYTIQREHVIAELPV